MSATLGPNIITSGLVLALDAAEPRSYPGTGTTWKDLSGNNYDFTLSNANVWTPYTGIRCMNFENGIAKYLPGGVLTNLPVYSNITICTYSTIKAPDSDWKTLWRGATGDHQVIISNVDGISLGMFDNNTNTFIDTGFKMNSISNYTTKFHFYVWKLSSSSPYYQFYYDGNLSTSSGTLTNANASLTQGTACIGGYHINSPNPSPTTFEQSWGRISNLLYYNRHLSETELRQNYNAIKSRFNL